MNPSLKNFLRRNNLSDVRDLLNVYEKKCVLKEIVDPVDSNDVCLGEGRQNCHVTCV